ncbi:MAG TPA: 50S ribosomal protein L25 [candidate division Zixibacteria bacterium]|jgi:large subunit ribosomal protein L25
MKTLPLSARPRTASGKGGARKLRATGSVPGILYGEKTDPMTLTIPAREITLLLKKASSEHSLVDLTVEGGDGAELALIKEVQHDPITEDILHIDLQHIHADKRLRVTVPVHLIGVPDGVKNFGGILQHALRDVEVEALPVDIPDFFDVDVSALNIHEAMHVSDLKAERVTIVTPQERTVASVVPPTVVKETTPEEAAAATAAESAAGAPEVLTERKMEEGEEEEPEGKKEKEKKEKKEK